MENCILKTLKGSFETNDILPKYGALTFLFDVTETSTTPGSASYIAKYGVEIRTSASLSVDSKSLSSLSLNEETDTVQLPWSPDASTYYGIDFPSLLTNADLTIDSNGGMYGKNLQLNLSALKNIRFLKPKILKYISTPFLYLGDGTLGEPFDLANVNWSVIKNFTATRAPIYGVISNVNTTAEKINCELGTDTRGITCDISVFENCTSLNLLGLYGEHVTGDLDALFDTWASKGKTQGSVQIKCEGTALTTEQSSLTFTVTFTSDTTTYPRGWYV